MKKTLLLFCTVLLSIAGWAQTPAYFVGGTLNTNANSIPIGGNVWVNNRSQLLYLSGEFGPSVPAGMITTIYVRSAASVIATYTDLRIDMGQSNITTLTSGVWETGLTTVVPATTTTSLTGTTDQWLPITLATPIPYDPAKSLIVDIRQTNTTPFAAITLRYFTIMNSFRRTWTSPPSNSTSAAPNGIDAPTNSVEYDFGFDLLTSCDKPVNIKKQVLLNSANITWDPMPGALAYEYVIDQTFADPPSSGYTTVGAPTLTLNGLPDGTCYYVHLRTNCAGSMVSGWSLDSFCTVADCKVPAVTIESVTGSTAIARWDAVPGAFGYEYSVGVTPTPPIAGAQTTYTNVKLLGLMPNAPLYFYVRAKCTPTPLSQWGVTPFHTMWSTTVEDIDNEALSIEAFPNPVKDIVNVKINGLRGGNGTIQVADITGRIVYSQPVDNKELNINMSKMAAGMYYVTYADDNGRQVIKINKQ